MGQSVTEQWRKATYSQSNGGACVEVGRAADRVAVRDTANRSAGHIEVAARAWTEFLAALR